MKELYIIWFDDWTCYGHDNYHQFVERLKDLEHQWKRDYIPEWWCQLIQFDESKYDIDVGMPWELYAISIDEDNGWTTDILDDLWKGSLPFEYAVVHVLDRDYLFTNLTDGTYKNIS